MSPTLGQNAREEDRSFGALLEDSGRALRSHFLLGGGVKPSGDYLIIVNISVLDVDIFFVTFFKLCFFISFDNKNKKH